MKTDRQIALESDLELANVLRRISRAHEKGSGVRLTWKDVAILCGEFSGSFYDVEMEARAGLRV